MFQMWLGEQCCPADVVPRPDETQAPAAPAPAAPAPAPARPDPNSKVRLVMRRSELNVMLAALRGRLRIGGQDEALRLAGLLRKRIDNAAARARRKAAGKCRRCGRPRQKYKHSCDRCMQYEYERKRVRRGVAEVSGSTDQVGGESNA